MNVLYVCSLAHLTGHPPFECTKETRIMREHGLDVELLTFCGVHEGFEVTTKESKVMNDNWLFRAMRKRFVLQWLLRTFEYASTIVKACMIAGDRPIYLRDAEPFPHLVHLFNVMFKKRWVVSSTGGLYTTGRGISGIYKFLLSLTGVNLKFWYRLSSDKIKYSVQNPRIKALLREHLNVSAVIVPLGHKILTKVDKLEAREKLYISNEDKVLLILGANHSGKDTETVIKAIKGSEGVTLIHAGPSVQSAGENPAALVLKHHAGANVKILDRQIGNEEKKTLFGAADWAVLSYNKSFASTTSMLWEAAAFGVPVIASSGNELEELVRYWNLGLVFEACNSESLRAIIERAKNLNGWTMENCKEFIEAHSESKWFQKTMNLLESTPKGLVRVAVSGGFDPFPHVGHLAHFKLAKELGDHLTVIVNSDEFLVRKKGVAHTPLVERLEQVKALRYVDEVVVSIDQDQTVAETLRLVKPDIFAKGGDRTPDNMPTNELDVCKEIGCEIVYGVQGRVRRSTGWEYKGVK